MSTNKRNVKTLIILVALLMLATVLFTACDNSVDFKPLEVPAKAEVIGNGGVAVKYGDYIYFVNGYQSSKDAVNTYQDVTESPRVGSVVRILESDLQAILAINEDKALSANAKADKIANDVREKVQTVVPKFVYSENTTNTALNGLYIFNDRIYITTPNDELTANSNYLTHQAVLTSFNLGGGDMQKHYTFASQSAQILLSLNGDKLYATYVENNVLTSVDVASGKATEIAKEISSVNFDKAGNCVFYISKDKEICKYAVGAEQAEVVVANQAKEGADETTVTYTIKSVNDGYVYYTKADSAESSLLDGINLLYASSATKQGVAYASTTSGTVFGYQDKGIVLVTKQVLEKTLYTIKHIDKDGNEVKVLLPIDQNDNQITLEKLEGTKLFYKVNNVSYTIDLAVADAEPIAYAYSLSTTAAGWAIPEVLGDYAFTPTAGAISVVKFDRNTKTNSASVAFTLTAKPQQETK